MSQLASVDLTRGVYRRIYAGFITGRRINAVSMEAEAWFWRMLVLADDYGNLVADPDLLPVQAGGRRHVDPVDAERWIKELADARLIRVYTSAGDRCIHVEGFEVTQPAGRNGRRIRRAPAESKAEPGNPGESKAIQGNPGELCAPRTDRYPDQYPEQTGGPLQESLPACLSRIGVGEPARSTLLACPDLTTAEVLTAWQGCNGSQRLTNPVGALVSALVKAHGLAIPKNGHSKKLRPEDAIANHAFRKLRESRR